MIKINKKRILISLLVVFIIFIGTSLYIDNCTFEVSYLEVIDSELPKAFENTKIVQISDLHNKNFGNNNDILLEKIGEIKPDYIFLTGDLVSANDTDFTNFYMLAEQLAKNYPCYYIFGNHEIDLKNKVRKDFVDTLKGYNVTVLDNEKIELSKNGEKINLYGMWYNIKYYKDEEFKLDIMEKIMGKAEEGYNILLTHNPNDFEIYSKWGANLIFSGHVHGGMIRLPFVGGLISPDRTIFPKYDSGLYNYNNSKLIVSRGMSRGATGFRLFNRPELLVVTLIDAD